MGIFFKADEKVKRTFRPPPTPPPQRVLSHGVIHEQRGCEFLTRLPSELRNRIYCLVFGAGTVGEEIVEEHDGTGGEESEGKSPRTSTPISIPKEGKGQMSMQEGQEAQPRPISASSSSQPAPPAHPLSLLLTCRKISQEATILAFNTHTFTISNTTSASFFSLRNSTSHLSPEQFSAITTLALAMPQAYSGIHYHHATSFLANSMLLFPTVQRLEIRVQRSRHVSQQAHMPEVFLWDSGETPTRVAALRQYAPGWLRATVHNAVNGASFSWQTGQKWRTQWPQFDSPSYVESMEFANAIEGWAMTGSMSAEAVGQVDGVELCVCGCGNPSWVLARLIQETGRQVEVRVAYCGDGDEMDLKKMKVRLEPLEEGTVEPLPLTWLHGGSAAGWDADEKYWHALRARKGNLTAKWRLWGL